MLSGFVRATAEQLAKACDVRSHWDTLRGDPVEAIVACVTVQRKSVLAMHKRRKSAFETAFRGWLPAPGVRAGPDAHSSESARAAAPQRTSPCAGARSARMLPYVIARMPPISTSHPRR